MTTPAQVDLWRAETTEHQNLEFKEAKNAYDKDKLHAYCVALANEGGGHLLLGVADKPPRPVVGTTVFQNIVQLADDLFQKLGFRVDIDEVNHPDGRVLVFKITSRPHGTAYNLDGKYYMRAGANLVHMSEDRLRTIFAEGRPEWTEEPTLRDLTAARVVELLDTQTFFDLMAQPYPTTQQAVIDRLRAERLIDKVDGSYSIRRLAGLLLAKDLNEFPELKRHAPRVIAYNGTNKLSTRIDRTGTRGYAVGFQNLVDLVMSQLSQNESIEKALRTKVKLLPDDAIRELVANALVHQDLTLTGMSPVIEIYENRVEISNPGTPIVPVERFIDGYQSRNERLADFMRRMAICEERSSGIDRVVSQAELMQLPAPSFESAHQRTVITVFGPKSFEEMSKDDRIRACYQHCALRWVMREPMTNQSLRGRFGLTEGKLATVSLIIAATVDAKFIRLDEAAGESKRYARYVPFWA